jgi:hypothetical protein
MLTPEDHALIADAVREGMRSDPVPWHRIVLHLSLAVAALGLAVWVYGLLQDWRMPTQVSLTTSSRQAPKHMSWRGLPGQIDWDLTAEGEVRISARASNDLHSAFDANRPKDQPEPAIVILHRHSLSSESCLRAESDIQQRCDVPIAEVNDSTVGSVLLNDAAHIEEGDL